MKQSVVSSLSGRQRHLFKNEKVFLVVSIPKRTPDFDSKIYTVLLVKSESGYSVLLTKTVFFPI